MIDLLIRGGTVVLPGVFPVHADVAIEDGRIAAVGTHTELLAHNPHYRYVIASLDQEPRDLDSELSELEDESKDSIR